MNLPWVQQKSAAPPLAESCAFYIASLDGIQIGGTAPVLSIAGLFFQVSGLLQIGQCPLDCGIRYDKLRKLKNR